METTELHQEQIVSEWVQRLKEVPNTQHFQSDSLHLSQSHEQSGQISSEYSAETAAQLQSQQDVLGSPPYALLFGAFGLMLGRRTGERTLLLGFGSDDDAVPVRLDIDEDATVSEFLEGVDASIKWSQSKDGIPFGKIAERLGKKSAGREHPLIQLHFGTFEPESPEKTNATPSSLKDENVANGRPKFDLSIYHDSSRSPSSCSVVYATDVLGPDEAARLAADYCKAVQELLIAVQPEEPDMTVADIRCMSTTSRDFLDRINQTDENFPDISVDALFRIAAERWPTSQAVCASDGALTYAELAAAAAEQAYLLRAAGVQEGDTVLVGVPRSVAELVAILGTLWAGATYIGVDLAQPEAHTGKIIARASPAAAIIPDGKKNLVSLCEIPSVPSWQQGWEAAGKTCPPAQPDANRLAYITFTSGSTGEPKGVAIPHRGIIRLVHDGKYLGLGHGERLLRMSPLAFDASTFEIWGGLLSGATLEVCPSEYLAPVEITDFLVERQVTVAWLTAGLFRLVQEFAANPFNSSLRRLLTGGDVVPYEQIKQALTDNPNLIVTNAYGPTENTTFTTTYSVNDPMEVNGPLPIGVPVPGTRVYVLDERARLLAPGAVGELFCSGDGLAVGYLDNTKETDRAFGFFSTDVPERLYRTGDIVRIDRTGKLQFLGRKDDQVKIRGFRIELHAISEVLNAQDGVQDSIVTVTDGDSASKKLLAAIRMKPGATTTPVELNAQLRNHLPSYMIPHLWATIDQLPITKNGKIDRRKLAAIARPVSAFSKLRSA